MKPRKRRRLRRFALWMIAVAIVGRVVLAFAIEPVACTVAGMLGFGCEVRSIRLAILAGDVEIDGLKLWAESASPDEPLVELEYAMVDVATSALFTGELRVRRAEADGLDVYASRDADGAWNFQPVLDSFAGDGAQEPDTEPEEEDDAEPFDGIEFDLPFVVEAVRGSHLRLHLADALAEPALDTTITAAVRVSDVGEAGRATRLMVAARGPQVLDGFEMNAEATAAGHELDADLHARVRGLKPRPLAGYLELVGLAPDTDRIDADANLRVDAKRSESGGTRFTIAVDDTRWVTDDEEALALDGWSTAVEVTAGPALVLEPTTFRGARATVRRNADARFAVAGFAWVGSPAGAVAADADADATADDDVAASAGDADAASDPNAPTPGLAALLPIGVRVEGLEVSDCEIHFLDERTDAESPLAVSLRSFRFGVLDSAAPQDAAEWSAELAAPGTLGELSIDGELAPFADTARFVARLATRGGDLERLAPYLRHAGIESEWNDARLAGRFEAAATPGTGGAWTIDVGLHDVSLGEADAPAPWLSVDAAELKQLLIDPANQRVRLEEARLAGLGGSAARTADGAWRALGLMPYVLPDGQVVVHVETGGASTSTAAAAATHVEGTPIVPWRVEVARIAVEGTHLAIDDAALDPALSLQLDDMGLVIEDLALGGSETEPHRARVDVWIRQPGLADELRLTGALTSRPGTLGASWELALSGDGLAPTTLQPYLAPAGIEIVHRDAILRASVSGSAVLEGGAVNADLHLSDFALGDANEPFLALESLNVGGVRAAGTSIRVDEIAITRPAVRLGRDDQGALLAAGLRFGEPPAAPVDETAAPADLAADATAEAQSAPKTPTVHVVVDDKEVTDPFAALDALGIQVELGSFGLDEAQFHWRDESLDDVMDAVIVVNAGVEGLALRPGAAGARFTLSSHFGGEDRAISVQGEMKLDPRDLSVQGELSGDHLDFERLSAYFPPTVQSDARDAQLSAKFLVELGVAEAGGRALNAQLTDLVLHEQATGQDALTVGAARLTLPRIDVVGGVFEVGELTTEDVALSVHRDTDSRWHALGVVVDPAASAPVAEPTTTASAEPDVRRVSGQASSADADLPTVSLGALDVGIDRLTITDDLQPEGAEPLVLTLRAKTTEPQTLLSATPEELPPFAIDLHAVAAPLVGALDTKVTIAPFADQPRVEGTVALRELDGGGVVRLLPQLEDAIDASGLTSGSFDLHFEALLEARRRGVTGFELRRGFGVDVVVDQVAYRAEPDGDVLLGFESLEINAPRIVPARGLVHVQRVELTDPRARLSRDADGIHALGLVIDPVALQAAFPPAEARPAATEPATTQDAGSPNGNTTVAIEASAPRAEEPPAPTGEVRVDEFLISGLDFDFQDTSYDPMFDVPLTGLSFEVSRFTTLAFTENRPIRVNAYLEAGEVPLGEGYEPLPLFGEATLRGNVSLYPAPEGTVTAGVRELALRGLRGPAGASGVTIGDGNMDATVRVRLRGEDGMKLNLDTIFRDLSVSEPSDGPIARYLGIAMPLETALFALRKTNGNIEIAPPTIEVSASGVSTAEIASVATQAVAKEITLAVARSPLRVGKGVADAAGNLTGNIPLVGGVTGGLFGGVSDLMGGEEKKLPPIGSLEFFVGDANLRPSEAPKLQEAIRRLKDKKSARLVLVHELTQADLGRIAELANPSPEDCRQLAIGLRRKRAELLRTRDEVTAEARTQLLTGREDEAERSLARLRALDAEIGRTETALDETLALLQPGAERRADRRTREAALEVARARLGAVVDALRAAGVKKVDERVEVRSPRPRAVELEGEDAATAGGRVQLRME